MTPTNLFKYALLATLVIKLALAAVLPMSGDEAYFIVWGNHPDAGYYDHPPMVGWFLHLLLYLGSAEVIMRLPAILLATLIAWGIYRLLRPYDEDRAALVALLFLISPLNILNVLITTDTPLILFAFLSAVALFRALQNNSPAWYGLSGALLGMAFLSKYFAVLLGLAYLAYFLFSARIGAGSKRRTWGFIVLYASAVPFVLVNMYWNYTHCWDNILFNLYNRHEGDQWSPGKVAMFWGAQLYLMTPPVIYYLFRRRAELVQKLAGSPLVMFGYLFALPMAVFALLSLKKVIGLHWVLAFYPFLYVLLFVWLSREELVKSLKFMAWFSAAHLAVVIAIAALPMETWKQHRLYEGIVFMLEPEKIVEQIRPYEQQQFLLTTDSYSSSAIISYHYRKNFFVFGDGSRHARQDDIITDFRQYDGRNILILKKSVPDLMQYVPYFQSVESKQIAVRGATFYFVLGYGFDYATYRDTVLQTIKDKYYRIPEFLPHAPCYFCEKYFPEESR
ncbi:MAG: glycosyltransferase family 39 protein [Nitrosomonadales bacterium]|nr:glycosyltransferase family 39 protein [Nitrosomonadales bacterium]